MNSNGKINYIAPSLFALLTLMYYPLGLIRAVSYKNLISNWSELEGFTWEIAGFFALGMIFLKLSELIGFLKKHKTAAVGVAVFLLILFLQQKFIFPSFYSFGGGLSYLTIMLAGMLYGKELKKIFLPLLWILLLFSLLMDLHDAFTTHSSGLTGNWNWSATLTLASSGSIFFLFGKKLPCFERKWGIYFGIFTFPVLIYLFFSCHFPKGTILSAFAAAAVLLWCYSDYFFAKNTRFILLGAALLIAAAAALLLKDVVGALLVNDTRIYLWENGWNVFAANPLTGCGYGRYISESAGKMNIEYFLTGHAASIHTHPHNEFLFLLAQFGIGGLVIILSILCVFVRGIKLFERRKSFENGYFLFVFTVLFVHSFFDVLLMHWPNNIIFYLLCGALPMIMDDTEKESCEEKLPFLNCILCGIFILSGSYLMYRNFMASMYYRMSTAIKNNVAERLEIVEKSIAYRPTYKTVNDNAVLQSMLKNHEKAADILKNMSETTGIENFSHSNLSIALFYMQCDAAEKALPYFVKENEIFPLSVRNLAYYSQALQILNRQDESNIVEEEIDRILQIKGLTRKHLPTLVYNEKYDLNSQPLAEGNEK